MAALGSLAAFGSSLTWAFASVRYSQASRRLGSSRVNLARASLVAPSYLVLVVALHGSGFANGLSPAPCAWLLLSVFCSYGFADALFFSASRRVGVSTALSIASTYPLWATLVGVGFRGEPLGPLRGMGIVLCVGGVVALIRLAPSADGKERANGSPISGIALAGITSLLWAGNSIAVKYGSTGVDPVQVNALRYSFALLLLGVTVGRKSQPSRPIDWRQLGPAIVADGLVGSSLFVYGLSHSDLAIGATLTSLAPLISVPIATAVGEERWNLARLSAVALTVTGVTVLVTAT